MGVLPDWLTDEGLAVTLGETGTRVREDCDGFNVGVGVEETDPVAETVGQKEEGERFMHALSSISEQRHGGDQKPMK